MCTSTQALSIALSIRELIRQGYLFGAKVLARPLIERAVTLLYLQSTPDALKIWDSGWSYQDRPSLAVMMKAICHRADAGIPAEFARHFTSALNSATHGDPDSVRWNVALHDGRPVSPVSKMTNAPGLADEICADVVPWLLVTLAMMCVAFLNEKAAVQLVAALSEEFSKANSAVS